MGQEGTTVAAEEEGPVPPAVEVRTPEETVDAAGAHFVCSMARLEWRTLQVLMRPVKGPEHPEHPLGEQSLYSTTLSWVHWCCWYVSLCAWRVAPELDDDNSILKVALGCACCILVVDCCPLDRLVQRSLCHACRVDGALEARVVEHRERRVAGRAVGVDAPHNFHPRPQKTIQVGRRRPRRNARVVLQIPFHTRPGPRTVVKLVVRPQSPPRLRPLHAQHTHNHNRKRHQQNKRTKKSHFPPSNEKPERRPH